MVWVWDDGKNRTNRRKHGISFETAILAFDDPLMVDRPDPRSDGDRWPTLGMAGNLLLFVVHTEPAADLMRGREPGRIISARRATPFDRRLYEAGDF